MERTLPHRLREIAEQCGRSDWEKVLWRAATQLEIMYLNGGLNADATPDPTKISTLEEARSHGEKVFLQRILLASRGDKTEAAHLLGISRTAIYKALHRNGMIERTDYVTDV